MTTIIAIQQMIGPQATLLASLRAPSKPNGDMPYPLNLDLSTLPPLDGPAGRDQYGTMLRQALSAHPAIGTALDELDANVVDPALVFEIRAPGAESVRWEVLSRGGGGFVAVDSATPVGRIAGEARAAGEVRPLQWPLRVAAFISAAGVPGDNELDGVISGVKSAQVAGLKVRLDVYLGEQDLLDATLGKIQSGELKEVNAFPMPADSLALEKALNDRPAEIVHFFCHGEVSGTVQAIQLATIVDQLTEAQIGSVQFAIWRLISQPSIKRAWAVVLNCCEGAAGNGPVGSMAYRIVKEGGVATCVGMNEPIAYADANLITHRLYDQLFSDLAALAGANTPQVVDFGRAVFEQRQALRDTYTASTDAKCVRWALPAIYTTGAPLRVQPTEELPPDLQVRLNAVAGFLRTLPPDTPEGVRDDALKLLAQVPVELRPDRFGHFNGQA